eukprot:CAMPEP_0204825460 /NCGR_PEP_ID=MMETSP1346-20131115/3343_1 /ASSEMBLY_ACC=CAM_ASM_000771 /TAXON_ID=215587 /ORGANISM="Aplanochytrium stocchinoi, Strain GSBS06" /LENGTH=393 /DNA_ID=CAMNT_0051953103 /DNA_START=118 /DNA_END=1296 /DNA_ORIENTATION=+
MEVDKKQFNPGNSDKRAIKWDETLDFPLASQEEEEEVKELRSLLAEDFADRACGKWPDVTGDVRLLRFLRGYDHQLEAAAEAVRDMLQIRDKYNMDEVHESFADVECNNEYFPGGNEVQSLIPGLGTVGISFSGHPVCYVPIGRHNVQRYLEEYGEEHYIKFYLAQVESRMMQLHRLSEKEGRMIKIIIIIDLKGAGLAAVTNKRWRKFEKTFLNPINKAQAECLARLFFINAPWWILRFYNGIKRVIPPNTRRKIAMLGANYRSELLHHLDAGTLQRMLTFGEMNGDKLVDGGGDISIAARSSFERQLVANPGDTIKVEFELKTQGDVDFGVTIFQPPDEGSEEFNGLQESVLVETKRLTEKDGMVVEKIVVPGDGKEQCMLELKFSNTHSW